MAKELKNFKYRTRVENKRLMMQCMNSLPSMGKYPQYAPEEGVCDEWVAVNEDVVMTLCDKCVQRAMSKSPIVKIEDE
jgi:hypothetical protein